MGEWGIHRSRPRPRSFWANQNHLARLGLANPKSQNLLDYPHPHPSLPILIPSHPHGSWGNPYSVSVLWGMVLAWLGLGLYPSHPIPSLLYQSLCETILYCPAWDAILGRIWGNPCNPQCLLMVWGNGIKKLLTWGIVEKNLRILVNPHKHYPSQPFPPHKITRI